MSSLQFPPELLTLCPATTPDLLLCLACKKPAARWRADRQYDWGRVLYCSCGKDWVVCGFCTKAQTRMINGRCISAHNRNCHMKKRELDSFEKIEIDKKGRLKKGDDNELMPGSILHQDTSDGEVQWIETRKSPYKERKEDSVLVTQQGDVVQTLFPHIPTETKVPQISIRDFGNANSTAYFNADINGSGIADIVSLCQFGVMEVGNQIHPSDVQYATDVANFVQELTQAQRSDLSHILKGTVNKVKRDAVTERLWKTSIPTDPFQMRRQFWDGRSSFLGNIPYPTVESVGVHGYVSLRECIRNRLAFGFPLEKLELRNEGDNGNVQSLMQSRRCQKILRDCKDLYSEPVVVLFLKEWQDGYDPHSFSKANRGSAWLKTCTISEPHGHKNSSQFTYPIALGPANVSHEEIERRFALELRELSDTTRADNVMYSKIHGRDVRVHAELVCSLMDQPERRGANYLLGGNSLYGARWGYSINLQETHRLLVPCDSCKKKLLSRDSMWNKTPCSKCSQWEMMRRHDDNFLTWKIPKTFPENPNFKDGVLRPVKLNYSILDYAINVAHAMLVAGKWKKVEAETWLSYYCLNKHAQTCIVRNAQNISAFQQLASLGDEENEDYQALLEKKNRCPEDFQKWENPYFWRRPLTLCGVIDVPMHLLFLGGVQGVLGFIHTWLRKHGKFSNFMRLAEERMTDLMKFKLGWMKILPYKGDRLGGWVSENYVGFSRICKWFFLILDDIKPDDEPYQDPVGPQKKWKAVENRAWLKARGLPSEGLAKDLRERVAEYQTKGDVALLPPPGGTMEDIHALVDAMYEMVKAIMVFEVNDDIVDLADMAIKRFLTILVDCDKKNSPSAKVPFWISSYTYPCLLNIPELMKEYGPMKNLWEGGVRGEGALRDFKPLHASVGLRTGWAVQILNRVHQKKALRAIGATLEDVALDDDHLPDNEDATFYSHDPGSYWKYPNHRDVSQDHYEYKPLCLVFNGETYGAMLWDGSVVKFLCDEEIKAVTVRGMVFRYWKPTFEADNKATNGLVIMDQFTVVYSCVMLPLASKNTRLSLYAAVRDDYTMMDENGAFV